VTLQFITFLLDGLHEDLNRIKQKPYTESPDWKGGDDEELAKMARTCWELCLSLSFLFGEESFRCQTADEAALPYPYHQTRRETTRSS
jgi:ubiquitin C-terminal hydrolase